MGIIIINHIKHYAELIIDSYFVRRLASFTNAVGDVIERIFHFLTHLELIFWCISLAAGIVLSALACFRYFL